MKQHITQEQAVELDDQADKLAEQELQDIGEFHPDHWKVSAKHLCNLAIQHYIDQRVKDLPALPNFPHIPPIEQRGAWIKWGQQCAAHAAIAGALAKVGKSEPKPEPTQRQYETAMRQWNHWKSYAMELQARLVKYEGGSPMLLNTPQPAPTAQPLKERPDFMAGYDAGMADAKRMQTAQPLELPDEWPRAFAVWYQNLPDEAPENLWPMWAAANKKAGL